MVSARSERIKPEEIDIRLAVGLPHGETPLKLICPLHQERIGQADDKGSLAVYRKNIHCFGCAFHITRRYASLAFLLGYWDGRGGEDGKQATRGVRQVRERLEQFRAGSAPLKKAFTPPPIDPYAVPAFHQFLLQSPRPLDELLVGRRLSLETIGRYQLGYTGTHFSIPVYNLDGSLYTIRYRSDDRVMDTQDPEYHKYDGTWGYNEARLYPAQDLLGVSELEELWIVEGEYDALVNRQQGMFTLTITNGALNISKLPEMLWTVCPGLVVKRWVLATDQDGAGEQAAGAIRSELLKTGQHVGRARWLGAKDVCEYYSAGNSKEDMWYE